MTPSQEKLFFNFIILILIQKKILEEGTIKVPKLTNSSNYKLQTIYIKAALIIKDLFNFRIYTTKVTTTKALKKI